ncbi:MAG: hypothetical protein NBV65_07365, partial [Burkholderiaceae bacterium]|nr:hypothetical protein [Burkholderiaceae bacterium]
PPLFMTLRNSFCPEEKKVPVSRVSLPAIQIDRGFVNLAAGTCLHACTLPNKECRCTVINR